jgi:geranyl-CoA carboxylase alpha subunit
LLAQLRTARSEALHGFGNDELILEQALIDPRHVEVQLFGDQQGNLIYLGERDCSIQRRHQKVIEEAPCPVMTAPLRQAMGEAALKAGRAVNYVGAGTVEFLLDAHGQFYFLEMNTRLQVEHPVTELITGLDLVAWQLRIAEGWPLPLRQDQVQLNGHAMEVRLYAEDPTQGFLPQTGRIVAWEPALQNGVRIDHGLLEGQHVSPFYDPMLGKIIAHGASREEARRKLLRAVQDSVLLGLPSNQRLLASLLEHPHFISGDFSTGFIPTHFADPACLQAHVPSAAELAIAAALFYQASAQVHPRALAGWRNNASAPLHYRIGVEDRDWPVQFSAMPGEPYRIRVAAQDLELNVIECDGRWALLEIDGVRQRHAYRLEAGQLWLFTRPGSLRLEDRTQALVSSQASVSSGTLKAPMDGAIVDVLVAEGSPVRKGQLLVVLEAMKMEHPLKSGIDGVLKRLQVRVGDQVKNRQILLEVE